MGKIFSLDKQVAELIAAGEVVERPSSVVKELVENSVDAGATSITVEIRGGGIRYIRVQDNGQGILKEDVTTAFLRNATSKVRTADDLIHIHTLGFRGEALASIAAVSKIEMKTCSKEEEIGTSIQIAGGEILSKEDFSAAPGTTIVIRDLFFNTPARMKFLKKDQSEANAVSAVMDRLALSHPEVSFKYIRDRKTTLFTPGNGDLLATIYAVFGKDFAESLVPVKNTLGEVGVSGYISKPEYSRGSRAMQYFFVNGRFVKTVTGQAALEEAYKNEVMVHRYPAGVLFITLPAQLVDVNTHPAKIEVRFVEERKVYETIYYGAKNALTELGAPPAIKLPMNPEKTLQKNEALKYESEQVKLSNWEKPLPPKAEKMKEDFWQKTDASLFREKEGKKEEPATFNQIPTTQYDRTQQASFQKTAVVIPESSPAKFSQEKSDRILEEPSVEQNAPPIERTGRAIYEGATYIGEIFRTYVLFTQEDTLYLIDKHAAHERLLFEKLRTQEVNNSQFMLDPIAVTLPKEEYQLLLENKEKLSEKGIEIEDFGSGTLRVRAFPMALSEKDVSSTLEEIAEKLKKGQREIMPDAWDDLYHSMACKAAIKGNEENSPEELQELLRLLWENGEIQHCPHGRPVAVALTKKELEKRFGRIQ